MNELRARPLFNRGVPKAVDVRRSVKAVPKIDWPLWLRHGSAECFLIWSIEEGTTFRSVTAKDVLETPGLKNCQCQNKNENSEPNRSVDKRQDFNVLDQTLRVLFFTMEEPFERWHGHKQEEYGQREKAQCVKGLVGDRSRHDGGSKSIERKAPPRFATMADYDNQQADHGEEKCRKVKYATGLDDMVAWQRVPGLKQANHALVFQKAPDELCNRVLPGNSSFHVSGQLKPVCHCVGMSPGKNQNWNQC